MRSRDFRQILHVACAAIIVAAALVFNAPPPAHATTVDSTFTFTGHCEVDCTGTAVGTLVLTGYSLGNNIMDNNFVSFTYESNFMSLSFSGIGTGSGQISAISGLLPTSLPSAAVVQISDNTHLSVFLSGSFFGSQWCAGGSSCSGDIGNNGVWTVTPLPAALPLFVTGLGALGLLGWRRKRKAAALAA